MTDGEIFGDRLRFARRAWGLTQGELAERSGIGLNTINRGEGGRFDPRMETARRLADALQVRWEWLLTGDGPMVGLHQMTVDAQFWMYGDQPVKPSHPSAYIVSPGGPWRHSDHDPDGWEIDPTWIKEYEDK